MARASDRPRRLTRDRPAEWRTSRTSECGEWTSHCAGCGQPDMTELHLVSTTARHGSRPFHRTSGKVHAMTVGRKDARHEPIHVAIATESASGRLKCQRLLAFYSPVWLFWRPHYFPLPPRSLKIGGPAAACRRRVTDLLAKPQTQVSQSFFGSQDRCTPLRRLQADRTCTP